MPISRKKSGKKFVYFDDGIRITDENEVKRIDSLAIPPAWKDVEIAKSKTAKVQAKGVDASERVQSIYSSAFRMQQEKIKFERILEFAERLPILRKQVEKDLKRKRFDEQKVVACTVKLIDQQFFRVGNEQYAKEHQTYGITTLRSKHVDITSSTVTFDFVGKSGKEHTKRIKDPQIANIIKHLDEMPGYEIFRYIDDDKKIHDIHSSNVNAYIKNHLGDDFSAKDFRTWGGTLLAMSALILEDSPDEKIAIAKTKTMQKVVRHVANRLGNTPAVAKNSYIDPRIFVAFEDGVTLPKLKKTMQSMKPKKYLTVEEQCVLKVLKSSRSTS